MTIWSIGLSSWIIQDGNYGDFKQGEIATFALEFAAKNVRPILTSSPSIRPISDAMYHAEAAVTYRSDDLWIIDCGIQAYQNNPPSVETVQSAMISAEIYLGIDPFFYFEGLNRRPDIPPLRYTWHIDQILLETTPWIETKDRRGRRVFCRDAAQRRYREVAQTDAWNDDQARGYYILQCTCFDIPPTI